MSWLHEETLKIKEKKYKNEFHWVVYKVLNMDIFITKTYLFISEGIH